MDPSPLTGNVAATGAAGVNGATAEQTQSSAPPASTIGPKLAPLTGRPSNETSASDETHEISHTSSFGSEKLPQPTEQNALNSPESRLRTGGDSITNDDTAAADSTPNSYSDRPLETGRGVRRQITAALATNGNATSTGTAANMNRSVAQSTPSARGRGRGRGPGRPRGSAKVRGGGGGGGGGSGNGGGGRGGKRKREDPDEDDSDSSEVYTPIATTTKSGRSIQKPTTYVPPPPPPATQSPMINKRKRLSHRRNPESAVCKICLRGTSPMSNMIVFCDGCNTPYHRYCHHPPIDQAVVDEIDMEWYCRQCEKERFVPVPESQIAHFISAEGSLAEERRRYFSSLMPGMLVTLLTKATTLHPDLPLFDTEFGARYTGKNIVARPAANSSTTANDTASGVSHKPLLNSSTPRALTSTSESSKKAPADVDEDEDEDDGDDDDDDYDPDGQDLTRHPANYPRPGRGLMKTLPPDKDDVEWLVDDEDRSGTFTHIYRSNPKTAKTPVNEIITQTKTT